MAPVLDDDGAGRWADALVEAAAAAAATTPRPSSGGGGGGAPGGRGGRFGSSPLLGELLDPGGEVAVERGRKAREGRAAEEASASFSTWEGTSSVPSSVFSGRGREAGLAEPGGGRPYRAYKSEPIAPGSDEVTAGGAVPEMGTMSLPVSGGLALRRGLGAGLRVRAPRPPQGWREALFARGYRVGDVIGLSRANCGFVVVLVDRGGQSFAAKGTSEGTQDGTLNATLQREYRLLRRLRHPGVVRAEVLIEASGGCAIVMQCCPGKQLASLLPRHSGLPASVRHGVLEGVLDAVSYLHAQQVAHGDLHGHNVMVDCGEPSAISSTEAVGVRVVDFGSARDMMAEGSSGVSELEDVTKEILPPEAAAGLACPFACDVFATGLLAAGLCVGRSVATADVTSCGVLLDIEGFLRLSAAGRAHLRGMLAPLPDDRPAADACRESLPPLAAWISA